jgi:TatD DNase family protein
MWVDSHCHLSQLKLAGNQTVASELEKAHRQQVDAFLCVATDVKNTQEIQKLCKPLNNVWTTAGIHPLNPQLDTNWQQELKNLATDDKSVAIGETGLDYHYATDKAEQLWQRQAFQFHIDLAKRSNKPLVIHTRAARKDTLELLANSNLHDNPGVIHCFTEDWQMAKQFIELGFYISFSGIITFNNSQQIRDAMNKMPLERLLIETDSPYLAPVPYRGKPNTPAYVADIGKFVAEQRGISTQQLAKITTRNFCKLFKVRLDKTIQ